MSRDHGHPALVAAVGGAAPGFACPEHPTSVGARFAVLALLVVLFIKEKPLHTLGGDERRAQGGGRRASGRALTRTAAGWAGRPTPPPRQSVAGGTGKLVLNTASGS